MKQQDEGPRCSHCQFYRSDDQPEIGECHANPPRTVMDEDGSYYNERPILTADDYPCRHFKARQ